MAEPRISRAKARDRLSSAPVFILVEPQMGENIGATARAMLNFGVSALRLVRPRDGWPNPKATAMASGASFVIDHARVFDSVDEAIADCHYVVAATARQREMTLPVMTPAEVAVELKPRIKEEQRCAILFGGERNGLSSDQVARADVILSVPVNPAFASINLAQAALLVAYEWSQAHRQDLDRAGQEISLTSKQPPAAREYVGHFSDHLEAALEASGYFFPADKKPGMARNLRNMISRAGFTELEISSLHGVIKSLQRGKSDR